MGEIRPKRCEGVGITWPSTGLSSGDSQEAPRSSDRAYWFGRFSFDSSSNAQVMARSRPSERTHCFCSQVSIFSAHMSKTSWTSGHVRP